VIVRSFAIPTMTAMSLRAMGALALIAFHTALGRNLGAEGYGAASYGISIASLAAVMGCLGLPHAALQATAIQSAHRDGGSLRRTLVVTGLLVVVGGSSAGAITFALGSLFASKTSEFAVVAAWSAGLVPLLSFGLWRSRAVRGFGSVAAALVPEEIFAPALATSLIVFYGMTHWQNAFLAYGASYLGALLLGTLWMAMAAARDGPISSSANSSTMGQQLRTWIRAGTPMMLVAVAHLLLNRIDLWAVAEWRGLAAGGLYSAAARLSLVCAFGLSVVDIVVAPRIAVAFAEGNTATGREFLFYGCLTSALGTMALATPMLIWPEAFLSLYGVEYTDAVGTLRILVVSQIINGATGPVGLAMMMCGEARLFAIISWLGCGVLGAMCIATVPHWGVQGAAGSAVVAHITVNVAALWRAFRIVGVSATTNQTTGAGGSDQ
jgi:O-antigen/teichoic acid export membrane protein